MKFFLVVLLLPILCFAECVHEMQLTAKEIDSLDIANTQIYVEIDGKFTLASAAKLTEGKKYTVHLLPEYERDDYNKKYIKYYDYARLNTFLDGNQQTFSENKYQKIKIGESLLKRNLYVVMPQVLQADKKTVVMFCRHHGDEGTANWIVEGFVEKVFADKEWLQNFQLILYPMINPDGAEKRTRYNNNGRDLNRCWGGSANDEIVIIRGHLQSLLQNIDNKKVVSVLDMHGSFVEDFIYRVPRFFVDLDFFELQGKFIDQLAIHDIWQKGNFKLSEGSPGMSRIYLIKTYGFNALTHESIRNIPLNKGRSLNSLKKQGQDVYQSLKELYIQK
ncbi:M14 family zinc carboxypeptidase [Candidatus Uabimicrobium amorphum]|uniref:Peptidase n=1 Tax=Uabimicrobium amorphum TaxID=2596890 RepID=A0A5S9ITG9_UABAM|nr:succinylglutamate desuccinylase/aspartoacylase family protein [Candidatus Uabimicrobium amorphum]BBM87447.1 peptidase [Candidatus Uabimicrobium amorphum]